MTDNYTLYNFVVEDGKVVRHICGPYMTAKEFGGFPDVLRLRSVPVEDMMECEARLRKAVDDMGNGDSGMASVELVADWIGEMLVDE